MELATAERVRDVLNYDPGTGVFTWRVRLSTRRNVGEPAGCKHHGYVIIRIDNRNYFAHRLAWLYVYGRWPEPQVDHIDGVRTNNRIANLREVSSALNKENLRRGHRDSRHGFLGVTYHTDYGFWARIQCQGVRHDLGYFATPEAAHEAYLHAKRQLHRGNTL
jgi:hypothetical protein